MDNPSEKISSQDHESEVAPTASTREILCWAMYDVANSSYVTVVNTAIFNAYFVGSVAAGLGDGKATLLLTLCVGISNFLIVISAPVVGAIADFTAAKKKMLLVSTVGLAACTALLATIQPGDVALAVVVLATANLMFGTGEDLVAAFLPEIASQNNMGRVSGLGWTLGYFGGLFTLGLCLAYVSWAESAGHVSTQYVPVTMLIVAAVFVTAATPTFIGLKERAVPLKLPDGENFMGIGFKRLKETVDRASHYRDLFTFLLCLMAFTSGSTTVALMASVFATKVMGFTMSDTITMLMVVQIAGSAGAYSFGMLQDKIGSVKSIAFSLVIWIIAVSMVFLATSKMMFWIAAVLMGSAMGASQSAGRALVGQFSPMGRSAEFFGLWGLAVKLAAILGPITYGGLTYLTGGNYRVALISTIAFFVIGLVVLLFVDEERGRKNAIIQSANSDQIFG